MKLLVSALTLAILVPAGQSLGVKSKLVADFLEAFDLNEGAIFYCDSQNLEQWKILAMTEFRFLSFIDVSTENLDLNITTTAMKLGYRQLGVVFDLTSSETERVFVEFSRWSFFNSSYNWLMVAAEYERSLAVLEGKSINLDAEISLAILNGSDKVQVHDIYNPNSRTNGKIVSTPKGSWSESDGMKVSLNGSKFERRSNLNGAIITAGVAATTSFMKNRTIDEYMESE
jgi:hypothetical protein